MVLGFTVLASNCFASSLDLEKAQAMFEELKVWEDEGDWDSYYANKDQYEQMINDYLGSVEENSVDYYRAKFFSWKIANAFAKESRLAFDSFIIAIRDLDSKDQTNMLFVESVIDELRREQRPRLKDRVASIYKELLLQSKDKDKIKKQAQKFYNDGDIDSSISLYRSLFTLANDSELNREFYLKLVKDFAYNGVSENSDAAFAEELYQKLVINDGSDSMSESFLYLRALNLESLTDFDKAVKVYRQLINTYPQSLLKDECHYRVASIYAYRNGDFASARNHFSKVLNKTLFDVDVQLKNLGEIEQDTDYNLSVFLSTIKGNEELLRKNYATLRINPSKVYVGSDVSVDAMAMSSDTGCLVASGLYLWSGDYGQHVIDSNVAEFKTSFDKAGLRNIYLVEKATQGILGHDSYVCAAYNVVVNTDKLEYSVGDVVLANINISPVLPEEFVSIQWEVEGHGQLSADSNSVEFQFDRAGTFNVIAKVRYFGKDFAIIKKVITVNN